VREKATWYTIATYSLAVSLHNMKTRGDATSADHVAGAEGSEHFKTMIKEPYYLSQQIFNLDEAGLKFKHEMEAVMALVHPQ
jgi:hypothetical protein